MLAPEIQNRIIQLNQWIIHPDNAQVLIERFIPATYVTRSIEQTAISSDRALLIIGPRQSGKSTMAWHLLRRFIPDIVFLNAEDPLIRSGCSSPADFIDFIRQFLPSVKAIFIDEAQHLEEAGLFVKGLVDARLDVPILVTGSSSFHLSGKTRESLAGRAVRKRLLPFSVHELIEHIHPENPLALREHTKRIVDHQLVFGSYPAIYIALAREEKLSRLSDLVDSLILRDASDLFKIKRIDAFRKLLILLAGQIGSLINYSELASLCNVDVGTVSSYIDILEESHIIKILKPYAAGKRREITGAPKVFFLDNGVRNQLIHDFSAKFSLRTDKGQLFENWVFTEIYKAVNLQVSLQFWRSKAGAEVDFIIACGEKLFGVEVKCTALKKAVVSRSMRSFIDAYKPQKCVIVNMSLEESAVISDTEISYLTPQGLSQWLGKEEF